MSDKITPTGFSWTWNKRYMRQAEEQASYSKDPKHKVGAVIIAQSKESVAASYNAFPRNARVKNHMYHDVEFKRKNIVHAETNALMNALRNNTVVTDTTVFVTLPVCPTCAGLLKQAGVKTVVYKKPADDYYERHPVDDIREMGLFLNLKIFEMEVTKIMSSLRAIS